MSSEVTIYTLGHSNRKLEEFLAMLAPYQIELLADVRTIPRSLHNPQYNSESLPEALANVGINYEHLAGLGGLRHPSKDSLNIGWRNLSFRGYADYMQTPAFTKALSELTDAAGKKRTAIMCAEALPWRCHRSLIGDALLVRGFDVQDIFGEESVKPHKLTPWAKVNGLSIAYPGANLA
jgi:uncharacterized protein (DUF488 family)